MDVSVEQVSSVLLAVLEGKFGGDLTSVVLFGSRVKGGYKPASDYDFLVVCRELPSSPLGVIDLATDVVCDILFKMGVRVSPIFFSEAQFLEEAEAGSPFLASLLTGYRIICDRGKFVAKALETLKSGASTIYKERGRSWVLRRTV